MKWEYRTAESMKRKNASRLQRDQLWFRQIKAAEGCKNCGISNPTVLQFHHRNPEDKLFSIGCGRRSRGKLLEEMAKCDVLCANCHLLAHEEILR